MPSLDEHVAAPGSINSKRITAKPAREGFVSMCACTEPVRTGIGAVCVEYGRLKWLFTMLNHTDIPGTEKCFYCFYFWHPMLVRLAMKRLFCLKAKNGLITRGLRRGGLTPDFGGLTSACGSAHACNGRGCRKTEPISATVLTSGARRNPMVESDWAEKE